MKDLIIKIFKDTFTNPETLKVSRKSLTMFFSFVNLVALTWVEIIFSMPIFASCCRVAIPEFIIIIFAGMALGQGALTVWDKKK